MRTCLIVLAALAILLAGCGSDNKDKGKSPSLPQEVSYLDGALSFRLPEGWLSAPTGDSSTFVILNNPALMDEFENTEDITDSAVNAFGFAYDPTLSLENAYLTTKENVVIGSVIAVPVAELGQDMKPQAFLEFMIEQGKTNLQDSLEYQQENEQTEPVYDQSVYDGLKIKTFDGGAFVQFKSAGNFPGMLGIIRASENYGAVFLATDKPDDYMSTFESIIRSVKLTDGPLPVVTQEAE